MKNLLKALTRPLRLRYCEVCDEWYSPSDPQGNWQHVNCS